MKTEMIQIRENQRDSWNTFSPGWKKWDDFTMRFLREQGDRIIAELQLDPSHKVLDIASGTGEPGLTIAASILHSGSVTAVDLSDRMLGIAHEKARALSIDNFSVRVADACELPFEDATFDAISCRLGFMFFPDPQLAAREMVRVLKPGGRIVATVWAEPERNAWITTMVGALKRHADLPAPDPNGPGMFRCAAPGFMRSLFAAIGTEGGEEKDIVGLLDCRSADEYWEFMNDVVPPVVSALRHAPQAVRDRIRQDVYEAFEKSRASAERSVPYAARLLSVRKAA